MPGKRNTVRKRNRQNRFSQLPSVSLPRSAFDRSCGFRTTIDSGFLYPVFVDEVLPGDTFKMSPTVLARLATPLHPVMDNMYLDLQFFYVPNRILWDNWERFMGAKDNPGDPDPDTYAVPTVVTNAFGWTAESLGDYFGLPVGMPNTTSNALPFRAFYKTYNDWYRSQDLQDSLPVNTGDGPDIFVDYIGDYGESGVFNGLPKRGKRHDYFTSCLPFAQKGPNVQLPLGTTAPVNAVPGIIPVDGSGFPTFDVDNQLGTRIGSAAGQPDVRWRSGSPGNAADASWAAPALDVDLNNTTLTADLSTATSSSVNELREALTLQHYFEKDARGGTRYTEILRHRWGVVSPDQRLQRAEYLGGGSARVGIHQVPQTSETGTSPQGNLTAYGQAVAQAGGWQRSFVEHGWVIGIASLRADLNYQQGMERMWSRRTRFDYYSPELANLGEQAVLSKEIFFDGTANDDDVFGYNERWSEYKYKPSRVTGVFRSSHPQTLDTWHLAQDFATRPLLNADFIKEQPPINRAIAVPSEPELLVDFDFRYLCVRPMPVYSTPGLRRF